MSALAFKNFGFEDTLVRVQDRDGAPWFVAQDVCACLEIGNVSQAVAALDEDEKGICNTDTNRGSRQVLLISESGLYALIFKSRKAAAVRFRKWVTSEVLPAIRMTGGYRQPANDFELLPSLLDADDLQRATVALSIVREARQTFGRQAARRVWRECGLPAVDGPTVLDLADDVPPSMRDWLDKCVGMDPEAKTGATTLFTDYRGWCSMTDQMAVDQTIFGRTLTAMGFLPCKGGGNGRIARRGLFLKS